MWAEGKHGYKIWSNYLLKTISVWFLAKYLLSSPYLQIQAKRENSKRKILQDSSGAGVWMKFSNAELSKTNETQLQGKELPKKILG